MMKRKEEVWVRVKKWWNKNKSDLKTNNNKQNLVFKMIKQKSNEKTKYHICCTERINEMWWVINIQRNNMINVIIINKIKIKEWKTK